MAKPKDGKGPQKPAKDRGRYINVIITPALDEMLAAWKMSTKQSYTDTARQALYEYLNPRLEKMAPRPPTEAAKAAAPAAAAPPNPRQIRRELIAACLSVCGPYLTTAADLQQAAAAKKQLEALILERREDFEVMGMDATGKSLLSVLDTETAIDPRLRDTVERTLNPISRHREKK